MLCGESYVGEWYWHYRNTITSTNDTISLSTMRYWVSIHFPTSFVLFWSASHQPNHMPLPCTRLLTNIRTLSSKLYLKTGVIGLTNKPCTLCCYQNNCFDLFHILFVWPMFAHLRSPANSVSQVLSTLYSYFICWYFFWSCLFPVRIFV
jgi:hypothetical protein